MATRMTICAWEVRSKDRILTAQGYVYVDKVVPAGDGKVVIHTSRYPMTLNSNATVNVERKGESEIVTDNAILVNIEHLVPWDRVATSHHGFVPVTVIETYGKHQIQITLENGEKMRHPRGHLVLSMPKGTAVTGIDLITPEILSAALEVASDIDHEDHDQAVTLALQKVAPMIAAQAVKRAKAEIVAFLEEMK